MAHEDAGSVFSCTIPDMDCPGCLGHVEQALDGERGVRRHSVSLLGQRATVEFDPSLTTSEALAQAIRRAGYSVQVASPTEAADASAAASWWPSRETLRTLLSGVLLLAGLAARLLSPAHETVPVWRDAGHPADLLLIAAAVVGGLNFFPAGWRAMRRLSLDMDFLMTVAILGAVAIGDYAEAAAIAFLFSVAEMLEEYAVARARRELRALVDLTPQTAVVRREGREVVLPAAQVVPGEVVLVRPGEQLPVDGDVVLGASAVDQSTITGESLPVTRQVGDAVFAGTLNQEGYLEVRTRRTAGDTTLGRIIHMVEEAEERRAPSERFVRRFARYYTPAVSLLALAVVLVPPLLLDAPFALWFVRGLTLLVIACPCALLISTPVAVVSAITSAARHGVLIKGGAHLEELARVRVVALDKTGTVTHGHLRVTDVLAFGDRSREEVVRLAAAAEQRSQHPVARAIVAHGDSLALPPVTGFESLTGRGVRVHIDGVPYLVGRPDLFDAAVPSEVASLTGQGKTVVLVGRESEVLGAIAVADTVRPEAHSVVRALQRRGLDVVLLTGDNPATAAAIAAELGIAEWRADMLPHDKMEWIGELERSRGKVAMVGDGVNDAPALAAAAVGVAMGAAGSDAALETADVALMGDDLSRLPYLFELSCRAGRVIRQNVWTSILVKSGLALGVFPGVVTLAAAVLVGDMGTSLGVTTNALRLSRVQTEPAD